MQSQVSDYLGRTYRYDRERFDFRASFAEAASAFVRSRHSKPLDHIEQLHRFVDPAELDALVMHLYRALRSDLKFQAIYSEFAALVVRELFGSRARFQKNLSLRVQLPGFAPVHYHTDVWYGHGDQVVTFWLPMVDVSGTASLFLATPEDSERMHRELIERRVPAGEMDASLAPLCRPASVRYGEALVFLARQVHGSELNKTEQTRVSFDFRILPEGASPGNKPESFFVSCEAAQRAQTRREKKIYVATAYFNHLEGFVKHLDNRIQIQICTRYAEERKIRLVVLETEIHSMTHYPYLFEQLHGSPRYQDSNCMVISSVCCLPSKKEERTRVYELARARDLDLFFVCEDLHFPEQVDQAEIECTRAKILQDSGHG